jgi:succinate-semialdehyde dehydrogenase/glutarate-semialdehyde dehydrogenase
LSLENGKPILEARGEINYAAAFISWFAEEAVRAYGDTIPSSIPGATVWTTKEPIGVCGIITPWNFPAAMITRKIAPALAAGCSVVIKPPSETPLTACALVKLAIMAGFPPKSIQVVPTKSRDVASELASSSLVKKLSFTGSTGVGKYLTELAAKSLKKVSLELGGNAAFIVFEDADLDLAVQGAMQSKFRASGQTCVVDLSLLCLHCQDISANQLTGNLQCANRFFVHSSVMDDFTERLVVKVKELKLGFGLRNDTTQGPLVNKASVEKVASHVENAVKLGGQLVQGGTRPTHLGDGYFYEPTVVKGATKDMLVASDETFGPLAAIFSFESEEEVIEEANSTEFGLASYFYSKDVHRVIRVSNALQSGMVGVNIGLMSAAETPFGGIKESGYGREGSKYGLGEYQVIKSMTLGSGKLV